MCTAAPRQCSTRKISYSSLPQVRSTMGPAIRLGLVGTLEWIRVCRVGFRACPSGTLCRTLMWRSRYWPTCDACHVPPPQRRPGVQCRHL
eukprot:scaffold1983_cov376-Prasinococcus_capsulatus_cf.AAC.10